MQTTLEKPETKEEFNENHCYLCGDTPAFEMVFHCSDCNIDFWKGYLCRRALESLRRDKRAFVRRNFPNIHNIHNTNRLM